MHVNPANPVIVQGDGKVLLETKHPKFDVARDFLARFAELESSPTSCTPIVSLSVVSLECRELWNDA